MQLDLRELLENCLHQVMEPRTHHMLCDSLMVVVCIFFYGELWTEGNTHLLFECTVIWDTSVAGECGDKMFAFRQECILMLCIPFVILMVHWPSFEFQVEWDSSIFYMLWEIRWNEADGTSEDLWTQLYLNNVVSCATEGISLLF